MLRFFISEVPTRALEASWLDGAAMTPAAIPVLRAGLGFRRGLTLGGMR